MIYDYVSEKSKVDSDLTVQHSDLLAISLPMVNRMKAEGKSDEYCSWHCYVYTLKTEAIITLNQVNYKTRNHDKY